MINVFELQKKQDVLNQFIIDKRNIVLVENTAPVYTKSEFLKNMILACHDEIREVLAEPEDVTEYIDVLHFVLSLGNIMEFDLKAHDLDNLDLNIDISNIGGYLQDELLWFTRNTRCFKHWSSAEFTEEDSDTAEENLNNMMDLIMLACHLLNEDMVTVYNEKYDVNVARQNNGY